MDLVGLLIGWVTIPMALLSLASIAGGLVLLMLGAWQPLVEGGLALALCFGFSILLERVVVAIDDSAARTLALRGRPAANRVAIVSGGLPILAILAWETLCFFWFRDRFADLPALPVWLWSYGVATGPWTIFASRVSRFRRTLCGIRAYAGHLAYWLLSGLMLLGASPVVAIPAMLLPSVLPFVVGMLLALADRDALTNVRV